MVNNVFMYLFIFYLFVFSIAGRSGWTPKLCICVFLFIFYQVLFHVFSFHLYADIFEVLYSSAIEYLCIMKYL